MKYYPFTLAVGVSTPLHLVGTYMRYYSVSSGGSNPTLQVKSESGADFLLKPGQSIRFPKSNNVWSISNYEGIASITGVLVVGDGEIVDNRISGDVSINSVASVTGTVSVIEGGKVRTLSGIAFSSAAGAGALAANYTFAQLWNKSVDKNLIVNRLTPSLQANSAIIIGFNSAALANLNNAAQSKLGGGAASVAAEARYEQNAVAGTIASTLTSFYAAANVPTNVPLVEPIIVPPGKGLCVRGDLNTVLNCGFDHWEEAV
jgi:hypothetical protein